MIIKNVRIFTNQQEFQLGEIHVMGNLIEKVVFEEDTTMKLNSEHQENRKEDILVDGKGMYAIPGMIDMHFHGCNGYDLCDGTFQAMDEIAKYEAYLGVTSIVPATMTLEVKKLEAILHTAAEYRKLQMEQQRQGKHLHGASLVGIHMEGPFISKKKRGAQDERYILPCALSVYERFMNASEGLVKVIGIAPENGDTTEFITSIKDEVVVSIAHSNANYDTAKKAFDAGASHAVHLYNAMSEYSHRAPGIVGAAMDCEHVTAELICDGVHVHPCVVRATFRMFGAERIILISDSMRATGLEDGVYTLGGLDVKVQGNHATMVRDGALAGSVTALPDCVRIAVQEMGIPLEAAITAATINPARKLGIDDSYGTIEKAKVADIVLLDSDLVVRTVIKDGEVMGHKKDS